MTEWVYVFMATEYTRTVLFIGNRSDSDPYESYGDAVAENSSALLGTFDQTDGISLASVTYTDRSGVNTYTENGVIEEDVAYDYYGGLLDHNTDDTIAYNVGSGDKETQLDNLQVANVTLTLGDNSEITLSVVISQMTNGDIFLSELQDYPGSLDNLNIQSVTVNSVDSEPYSFLFIPPNITATQIVCFVRGTNIETNQGLVKVEDLRLGDLVVTQDNGLQPIRWINRNKLTGDVLKKQFNFLPIRIKRGSLSENSPSTDLLVSPQHRVLVRSKIAQRMFKESEVLVAAKQLCQINGIEVATDVTEVEYHHFLLDRHEVVFANGAATESLYTGTQALKSVGPEAREEIFQIFPELRSQYGKTISARPIPSRREGLELSKRHKKNNRPLVSVSPIPG